MKYVTIVFVAVVLLAGGFAGMMALQEKAKLQAEIDSRYDLDSLPEYDYDQAAKDWESVAVLEQKFGELQGEFFELAMRGGEFSEDEKTQLKKLLDIYLYWKAVAEVQVFHAKDTTDAVARATDAIDDASYLVSGVATKVKSVEL